MQAGTISPILTVTCSAGLPIPPTSKSLTVKHAMNDAGKERMSTRNVFKIYIDIWASLLYNIDGKSCVEVITLRKWLKDIRARQNMTQQEVANAANVDATMISKIELGERRPSVEVAKKIASVLGFDWVLFYQDEDELTKTGTE